MSAATSLNDSMISNTIIITDSKLKPWFYHKFLLVLLNNKAEADYILIQVPIVN